MKGFCKQTAVDQYLKQTFWFQIAVTLKLYISDPDPLLLSKEKCVWEAVGFFSTFKYLLTFFSCLFTIHQKKSW